MVPNRTTQRITVMDPFLRNVFTTLAKSVLIQLRLTVVSFTVDAPIQNKIYVYRNCNSNTKGSFERLISCLLKK